MILNFFQQEGNNDKLFDCDETLFLFSYSISVCYSKLAFSHFHFEVKKGKNEVKNKEKMLTPKCWLTAKHWFSTQEKWLKSIFMTF